MSHEPGRERHMVYRCENCSNAARLLYESPCGEYMWCESCIDNANEAAYMAKQERDLESPPESTREEQVRTWEEKQKLHRR